MAPALLGPHRKITCPRCHAEFPVDWKASQNAKMLRCPDCGFSGRRGEFELSAEIRGDRVFLDRTWFSCGRKPRRWELVAFRNPEDAREFVVKRIVGLPGEEIHLHSGDVYVNGRLTRKSLDQFLATAVPVFRWSAACGLNTSPGPGWFTSGDQTGWAVRGDNLAWETESDTAARKAVDWLMFHPENPGRQGPILDDFSYNLGLPRRVETVNPVADIGVSLSLIELSEDGILQIRLVSRGDTFELRIDRTARVVRLFHAGRNVRTSPFPDNRNPHQEVIVAAFDRSVVASLNGIQILEYDVNDPSDGPTNHPPVSLGMASGKCQLREIRIFRDAYYDLPHFLLTDSSTNTPTILGEDSYYCLGDNSDISEDSRTWRSGPELPGSLIVGRPVFAIRAGGGQSRSGMIPVPKPVYIHYIQ